MGTICSKLDEDDYPDQQHEKQSESSSSNVHKKLIPHLWGVNMARGTAARKHSSALEATRPRPVKLSSGSYVKSLTTVLDSVGKDKPLAYGSKEAYLEARAEIANRESSIEFDYRTTQSATKAERSARAIVETIRRNDQIAIYDVEKPRIGYGGQKHPRFAGDHFLTNADLLESTGLFKLTKSVPKGAHLHIHFNSCLLPHVLLDIAKTMESMYICSNLPLTSEGNLNICEIQFLIKQHKDVQKEREALLQSNPQLTLKALESESCNLLHPNYMHQAGKQGEWMNYKLFREQWEGQRKAWKKSSKMRKFADMNSVEWLMGKLVFNEEESYHIEQTADGAWEKFNGRTRMMKGLFNYETAFREYTRKCLEGFVNDNIQYAEIRPNFMQTNQIWTDDGTKQLTNADTMDIIVDTWQKFNKMEENKQALAGLKVIYCTPRSFPADKVEAALDECLAFKTGKYAEFIAGFDLVGEESKGKPLKKFVPEFLQFKENCRKAGVEIPFLFHCGETLELGGDTDGNLIDALLLDSKRIGHGFALARKPYLISEFKKRNICLEICPISNEVLGLTPRMNGHAMYQLLANDVHCTVNSDNGTLFRSTLSHDFYQVMVGSMSMNLHGWRQLIEWSIEHASMSQAERQLLWDMWQGKWDAFIEWVNTEFAGLQQIVPVTPRQVLKQQDGEAPEVFQKRQLAEDARYEEDSLKFSDSKAEYLALIANL
ncbi:hypothetical protein BX600DRAFT_435999 [Xylariales sp. PMI_506]|nr:hypothetical protein BX600DRAFT_435999 [Xylariales sp. PMI_506]